MKDTTRNFVGGTALMLIGGIGTTIAVWGMIENTKTAAAGWDCVKNAMYDKVKSLKAKKD